MLVVADWSPMECFNPRLTSAARRTLQFLRRLQLAAGFQSTPHLSSEANADMVRRKAGRLCFNPRLTSAARRTSAFQAAIQIFRVSIHASPQQRGEPPNESRHESQAARVSIHASPQQRGERGSVGADRNRGSEFQSTPHLSSEANLLLPPPLRVKAGFNPRLTSAARRTMRRRSWPRPALSFNPRLTSAARRTGSKSSRCKSRWSFNPRLTSAARRTKEPGGPYHFFDTFQSTPHLSSEANQRPQTALLRLVQVSIHASPQQRGELFCFSSVTRF